MLRKTSLVIVAVALGAAAAALGDGPGFVVGQAQLGYVGTVAPPEVKCAGGEPTGLPFPQCTEGTQRILGRSEVQTWEPAFLTPNLQPLLGGPITFVVNCNFNAAYRGPCWGTFTWDIPDVGTWEGQWTAPVMDLMTYESRLSMVGFGRDGAIDGKQLRFDGVSAPGDWYINGTVRIH